jgi:uncharacterized repeat protein (TIGR03803 family)
MLIVGLGFVMSGQATAQIFTTLHSFTSTGSDGADPQAGLILLGNTLYGTTCGGGTNGYGTVFSVNTNGPIYTTLWNFTGGRDGAVPYAGLILSSNTLYGTTQEGGSSGWGTVFAINTNGMGFTNLYSFTGGSDGKYPCAGLILSSNTLYGTAGDGGSSGYGTVFAIKTDGTGFTNLHSFTGVSDGKYPCAGLVLSSNTLYGTAGDGGSSGYGTVFAIKTDGTGFTNLWNFTDGSDGAYPYAGLILSGNTLYGTAQEGGSSYCGTVFAINTDGTGFTNLWNFTDGSDGANPFARLILSSNTLYGTASDGGSSYNGTIFAINTDGTGFTTLWNFTGGSDGAGPWAGLILSSNTLYGTAQEGGSSRCGTVFSYTLPLSSALVVITTSLPSGVDDVAYSQTLMAFGGRKPYNWTISSGVLPPGLILATNGLISGTPTSVGTFNFTVQVTDANNNTATQALKLTVIPLQVDTYLPDGMSFTDYSWQLDATGGLTPYSWSLISGSLPSGLTLATNGIISGMPISVGTFNFTVQVTDANNNMVTQALSLNIDAYVSTSAAYTATESWSVTLTLGSGTGLSTSTYSGTETGTLTVNGGYQLINHTGYPISGSMNLSRGIVYSYGNYSIDGSECGVGGGPGGFYALIPLNFFLIAIPIGSESGFSGGWAAYSYPYSATGPSLSNFSGSGAYVDNGYPDDDLGYLNKVNWSSTSSLTEIVDTTSPTVGISAPTSGQSVSNNVFKVAGTANDNVAVMGVFYSLNNAGWATATTTNSWTNWTAALTLVPGTNTIAAFAVDTSGNVSKTNPVSFKYVVSAPLTVQMTGRGAVTPDYSNAVLQVGTTYSMTAVAVAGSGFAFTNWTGGTSLPLGWLTNGPTVQFLMRSNLTLQANFVDTNKPVLAITNLVAGQMVSNAAFTVMGWATDNVAVAGVYCSLSNSLVNTGFGLVPTANNWLNWSTNETLVAGTNTIRAYAVDTSGNVSTTNSVNLDYVVSAILTVSTNGLGSLNPNYNQALLQIGKNYSITATPGTGFMFTNWTGGTNLPLSFITNGATIQFLMVSNLMLQATFLDTNKPTLSITNLTAGQRLSNAVFTVKGTASDNWQMSNVLCQINGGVWNSATNINNWTNWSAGVTLTPGTNVVQAYAVDTSGNVSTTNSVSFQFVVTNQLAVRAFGLGTVSPNFSNAWLEIGRNYSITSAPATGFVFTNWVVSTNWFGGVTMTGTNLQFMMQSNLTLQANFVETNKPTLTITAPTSGQHMSNALATVTGTASDIWGVNAVWYQLTNGILTGGSWSQAATTNSYTNWSTTLTLAAGTNTVKAYAVNLGGNYSATNSVSFVSSNSFRLQLTFATGQPLAVNGLNFVLQVSTGLVGHVQVSTNLTSWATLTNFVGTNATISFRDPAATNSSRRFYRAVIP